MKDLKSNITEFPETRMPLVVENLEKPYLSILESNLVSAPGFELMNLTFNATKGLLEASNKTTLTGSKTITPWAGYFNRR